MNVDSYLKVLSNTGDSEYVPPDSARSANLVAYFDEDHRGICIKSLKSFKSLELILSESVYAAVPIGTNYNRVCFSCLSYPLKKVKVRSDCDQLYFCSQDCLERQKTFLDIYSLFISKLEYRRDENLIFALRILHNVKINKDTDVFSKILNLKHEGNNDVLSDTLLNKLIETKSYEENFIPFLLEILQAIRVNAQGYCYLQLSFLGPLFRAHIKYYFFLSLLFLFVFSCHSR